MFLGDGPQLVFAATGEVIDIEPLGGAGVLHSRVSGVTDHIAEKRQSCAMAIARDIVARLGEPPSPLRWDAGSRRGLPAYAPWKKSTASSAPSGGPRPTTAEILARLIDGSEFQEFKELRMAKPCCVTGSPASKGFEVGILAKQRTMMFSESAIKGAHFIELCCKRDIPLLFLVDVSGFMVGTAVERQGIAKHGAQFMTAMACADVPKYTIITGGSYAAAYFAMLGRARSGPTPR